MSKEVLLETKNLSVGYSIKNGDKVLLNNLDLSLRAGELVCFMGPNGIGKSTFIRTIAGLHPSLNGETIVSQKTPREQSIAVVLTDKIVPNQMLVYDLITFGRYPYLSWNIKLTLADREAIEKAITLTGVGSMLGQKISELSDGQFQLVMIARAIAQECPILLLDEPTAHLDLNNRVEIMNLLRSLAHGSNKAVLIATHELDLALQTADRIWLANRDKKILSGFPEDLVLDESFDKIFELKGFDLKTGKVKHQVHQQLKINLIGEGATYLWTKNALERCGYEVAENGSITIRVEQEPKLEWRLEANAFTSIESLIEVLKTR
jgi:iron complex transport system ATP-binding protein